ncbi:MAG TPA: hypothetical protein VFO85_14390, partial [Vicinamibacteria bacterium]|nr:hypothetical protein [Vicinamibacteria bacterium]
ARADAAAARAEAHGGVARERAQGDEEAARHHAEGQTEAAEARARGEEEAAREREKASQETSGGGLFGWVASKARSFFDGIKRGVQAAFALARQAVQSALAKAQQLAHAAIERARQAAVALVRAAGAALTAIANVALAAFPRLRDAAVGFIQSRVRAAEAAINALADKLKEGITAALDLLGRALKGILDLMERAYLAAVEFVASAVQAVINKARQALEMLGQFAALARDIAAGPGQWLRNLGAALMDGVRNHLWGAFKTAVKGWFGDKVEQVVGVGQTVWNLLVRGGITLAQIGTMVWEGIKAAIPPALVALLIEKLVSMLMPAAGAVLLIIQGLQAAWGAASRILQAFERFFAFLRAVRGGNAGPQFATAVAAAATAVLDFLANFLLARLARGASRVGQKLRSIAQRIGQRLRGALRRAGGRVRAAGRRLRDRLTGGRRRRRESPADRRRREQDEKQARLDRAVAAIRPPLERMLSRGTSGIRLRAQLLWWKTRYRLSSLAASEGDRPTITATVNPRADVRQAVKIVGAELHRILNEVGEQLMEDAAVRGEVEQINRDRARIAEQDAGTGSRTPRPSQSPAAESAVLHGAEGGQQRPPKSWESIDVLPGVTVHENQTGSSQPGSVITKGAGTGRDERYKSGVQQALRDL